ncbi:MAG TPA: adenylyltransferase [Alphaproteobacteria bacterium]|nr:adenylyltransferase [Alphaproteobacteria bacterium]
MSTLTDEQIDRYARHIILKEIGGPGQARLLQSKVLLIGAGGLGSPLALYLAAAGVGTIGIVDDDVVSLSNLQRQIAHRTADIGRPKTDSAADAIAALNPDVTVRRHPLRLTPENAAAIIADYDLVADGSDNFATRFLVNDVCFFQGIPLVSAALGQYEGQLSTYRGFEDDKPCYRCLFPAPPPADLVPSCAEVGILGLIAGTMACLQGTEIVKELVGFGERLAGQLLIYDALEVTFRKVRVRPDPKCRLCGQKPEITGVVTAEYAPPDSDACTAE